MTTSPSKRLTLLPRSPWSSRLLDPRGGGLILRRFGTWAMLFGLTLPVWAAQQPGAISGHVRNATGVPQMGAIVEVIGAAAHSLTVFTDEAGFFSASGLLPGVYSIKVSAPSFLPALRERIGLRPGASVNVNVTLNTLLGAIQVGPLRGGTDDEDWKWTLRSVANRPILRVFDGPAEKENHETTGRLSFLAGSAAGGYGSGSDLSTGFSVERSIFSVGHVGVSGNVGYGEGLPAAVLRTTYSHKRADGSEPSVAQFGCRILVRDLSAGWGERKRVGFRFRRFEWTMFWRVLAGRAPQARA